MSVFFKLFPPPRFMVMKHAGLDISDDAIRCLEYHESRLTRTISKHATVFLPPGMISDGDIKDEVGLKNILSEFDRKNDISYVKVSLPEEKAYLFQTEVPDGDVVAIAQNIEFKLEENVPLSAADAVFYFDLLPVPISNGNLRASVSVVPRVYIEHMIELLRGAGISPMAFELVPKAIARAIVSPSVTDTIMIVHVMSKKVGIYIVSDGVVAFTSTVALSMQAATPESNETASLNREIDRIYAYWLSHSPNTMAVRRIILVGKDASHVEGLIQHAASENGLNVSIANIWSNVFSLDHYLPPISAQEALDYAVAAGLAMY